MISQFSSVTSSLHESQLENASRDNKKDPIDDMESDSDCFPHDEMNVLLGMSTTLTSSSSSSSMRDHHREGIGRMSASFDPDSSFPNTLGGCFLQDVWDDPRPSGVTLPMFLKWSCSSHPNERMDTTNHRQEDNDDNKAEEEDTHEYETITKRHPFSNFQSLNDRLAKLESSFHPNPDLLLDIHSPKQNEYSNKNHPMVSTALEYFSSQHQNDPTKKESWSCTQIESHLLKVKAALIHVQKQLLRGEELYFQETDAYGNIFKGWDTFLDLKIPESQLNLMTTHCHYPYKNSNGSGWERNSSISSTSSWNGEFLSTPILPLFTSSTSSFSSSSSSSIANMTMMNKKIPTDLRWFSSSSSTILIPTEDNHPPMSMIQSQSHSYPINSGKIYGFGYDQVPLPNAFSSSFLNMSSIATVTNTPTNPLSRSNSTHSIISLASSTNATSMSHHPHPQQQQPQPQPQLQYLQRNMNGTPSLPLHSRSQSTKSIGHSTTLSSSSNRNMSPNQPSEEYDPGTPIVTNKRKSYRLPTVDSFRLDSHPNDVRMSQHTNQSPYDNTRNNNHEDGKPDWIPFDPVASGERLEPKEDIVTSLTMNSNRNSTHVSSNSPMENTFNSKVIHTRSNHDDDDDDVKKEALKDRMDCDTARLTLESISREGQGIHDSKALSDKRSDPSAIRTLPSTITSSALHEDDEDPNDCAVRMTRKRSIQQMQSDTISLSTHPSKKKNRGLPKESEPLVESGASTQSVSNRGQKNKKDEEGSKSNDLVSSYATCSSEAPSEKVVRASSSNTATTDDNVDSTSVVEGHSNKTPPPKRDTRKPSSSSTMTSPTSAPPSTTRSSRRRPNSSS